MPERENNATRAMGIFLGKMALVGVGHFLLAVALYYARIRRISAICHSDVLVFHVPAFLAFCGYFILLSRNAFLSRPGVVRLLFATLLASCAVAVSLLCFALFAFNQWGT
jgi:hypothetical protein